MRIALVSPYASIPSIGLRTISACLKQEGHDVRVIFLPKKYMIRYEEKILNAFVELLMDSDLIGISLMTNYFDNAVQLTQKLKQNINTLIMWGGIHPTIRPEECLNYADMVCIGEGEETLRELVRKMQEGRNYLDTQGMWFKDKERIVKNKLRPLVQDLGSIPFQDYDYDTHYILSNNRIRKMDEVLLRMCLKDDYMSCPSRGCPFGCTYCCNNVINKMYPDQKPRVRKRSIDNIINELIEIKNKLPFINHITFEDDAFLCYTEEEIEDFCERYKHNISLPLDIRGVNPLTLTRKKLSPLVDAGLIGLRLGIQTGSERTKKLYKRYHSNQQVEECIQLINEFKDIIIPRYDIIVNNPWETDEDLTETLMLLTQFPKPYALSMFSLTFYPGTELYNKAVEDGIVTDDLKDVYRKSFNVRTDGTTGRLLNETHFNNLFFLLHVYSLNGYNISTKTLSLLINQKLHPFKSRLLYFILRSGASLLLKKRLVRKVFLTIKKGGLLYKEEYVLD